MTRKTYSRKSFDAMHDRCYNSKNSRWANYGGRGIKVCERWKKFENFIADMGPRPDGMSLDRIDNDGDYSPENCKWSTIKEQRANRRVAKNEHVFEGKPLSYWSKELGVSVSVLRKRMWRNGTVYERRVNEHTFEGLTLRQWSEKLGVGVEGLRKRLLKYGDVHGG